MIVFRVDVDNGYLTRCRYVILYCNMTDYLSNLLGTGPNLRGGGES